MRVLLTGFPDTNKKAEAYLDSYGHKSVHCPMQEMQLIPGSVKLLGKSDWVIFTSPSAVRLYMQHLYPLNPFDKAACVGPATAEALEDDYARACSLMPDNDYSSCSLAAKILSNKDKFESKRVLFPCSELAGVELEECLSQSGLKVHRYDFYRPVKRDIDTLPDFDAVAFFSSSGVEAFFSHQKKVDLTTKKLAVIGESTAETLRQYYDGDFAVANKASAEETVKVLC